MHETSPNQVETIQLQSKRTYQLLLRYETKEDHKTVQEKEVPVLKRIN